MAHEIAHMLQGVSRHSLTGVMKPHWDQDDYAQMAWKPLEFTKGDIILMQLGIKARAERLSALVAATSAAQPRDR
jgi:hypothetical protein